MLLYCRVMSEQKYNFTPEQKARRAETMRRWRAKNHDVSREREKAYYYQNKEAISARRKQIRAARKAAGTLIPEDPVKKRYYHLLRKYGITQEDYEALLAKQGGHCAACPATSASENRTLLHVDHDHVTGAVRGLLCHHCNGALGHAQDNIARLKSLIRYLEDA